VTDVNSRPVLDAAAQRLFAGPGEMRERCRVLDWSATPLGAVSTWPPELRTAAQMVLAAGLPNIVLWGPELIQIYNDAYAEIIQAKHPYALGRGNQEVWPEVWHINGPIYERVFAGETLTFSDALYPLARAGGGGEIENVYLTISFSPIQDSDGAVAGVLANMIETTSLVQRRALEAERERLLRVVQVEQNRLASVFERAPTFLAVMRGPEHVVERANDAFYQLVGHRDLVGRRAIDAVPEAAEQGFVAILDQVYSTGEPFVGREVPILLHRTPGAPPEQRHVDFVYQPLMEEDEQGVRHITGIAAHGYDITEQVLARRAVEQAHTDADAARVRAEEANRAKSDFLGVISHELRTPLNAIGGYAELIELGIHGPVTPKQTQALARIQTSQRHLLGLINSVLNYTRVEAGAVLYDVDDVPIDEILTTCEALVLPQVRTREQTLRYEECDPSLRVHADREKVQQIVLNLLSNAVKFTPKGGHIEMRCRQDHGAVAVVVSDNGRGIAADQLERIFQPFVQVDARLTREQEGVGLGLAISRDLARAMGGDLAAESTVGSGSTFTLTLPRA
jgi:signal transduction histidine kinase